MRNTIREFMHIGVFVAIPLMHGGYYEESAGIRRDSDAAKCYYAYTNGKDAISPADPWLHTVAKNYEYYARMSGEQLISERIAIDPDALERRIIDWILVYRRGYPFERVQELSGETGQPYYSTAGASAQYPEPYSGYNPYPQTHSGYYPNSVANPGYPYPSKNPPARYWSPQPGYAGSQQDYSANPNAPQRKVPVPATSTWGTLGEEASFAFNHAPSVLQMRKSNVSQEAPRPEPVSNIEPPANRDAFAPKTPSPFEESPAVAPAKSVPSKPEPDVSPKKVAETPSPAKPAEEDTPPTAPKIEIFDKNTIQISLGGEIIGKYTYDSGLWNNEIENTTYLTPRPLEANHDDISFELGGVNFKVHLNGDIEVFGSTPVMRCVLECPSEGKLIIPAGKELQVNRFVCMTRGKTIENYGRVAIAEACFCFEQTIINHGEITTLEQPGKPKGVLLLLQSELKSDGGVEDIKSIHLKDRSYPEYGCCCFYGFDRSFLYPSCKHPNYPDTPPTIFVDLHERDFLYPRCNSYVQIPFKGHTKEGDYDVPFTGDAVLVLLASGNHGASNYPEKDFYFRFCESPSGRPFASYSSKVKAKTIGDSLNGVLCCKLPIRFKVYFRGAQFMIYEGSKTYITPALYFFKL